MKTPHFLTVTFAPDSSNPLTVDICNNVIVRTNWPGLWKPGRYYVVNRSLRKGDLIKFLDNSVFPHAVSKVKVRTKEIPEGFPFADPMSIAHAIEAMDPDRPSTYLINADRQRTGKTLLTHKIIASAIGLHKDDVRFWCSPRSERDLENAIRDGCRRGYLALDNARDGFFNKPRFLHFLTEKFWTGRKAGTTEMVTLANNCLTIINGNDLPVSEDLRRRVKIINLSEKRRCVLCGCTDDDCGECIERTGAPCAWWDKADSDICTACLPEL